MTSEKTLSTSRFSLAAPRKKLNPGKFLLSRSLAFRNTVLKSIFGFNQWHVRGTYFDRPYKKTVVEIANSVRPDVVVEIGSGLGEIISRVQARRRFGFDIDKGALAAATLLCGTKVAYSYGSVTEGITIAAALAKAGVTKVDALILVNWIHELPFEQVMAGVAEIHKRVAVGHLIVDTINPGVPGYTHHHSLQQFSRYGRVLESVEGDVVRSLHLLAVDFRAFAEEKYAAGTSL